MNDRTIAVVKVQEQNKGFYCRIPADVAKLTRIRKGDYIRVSLSVDKRTIKLFIDQRENDIINLDDVGQPAHIISEPTPAPARTLLQRIGLMK